MDVKAEVLKMLEVYLEKFVQGEKFDALLLTLKAELEKAIPGQIDDLVLEAVFPKLMPLLKVALLKEIEKLSQEV
jgi:hypothetical protein